MTSEQKMESAYSDWERTSIRSCFPFEIESIKLSLVDKKKKEIYDYNKLFNLFSMDNKHADCEHLKEFAGLLDFISDEPFLTYLSSLGLYLGYYYNVKKESETSMKAIFEQINRYESKGRKDNFQISSLDIIRYNNFIKKIKIEKIKITEPI